MTWRRPLLIAAAEQLRQAGVASPENDAELLLAHVLGRSRASLVLAAEPSGQQLTVFRALVDRRSSREPLQHLTGTAAFRHVELTVGPGVFIPRPETEALAGWAIERLATLDAPVVVDLCTGSGAIAAAISDEVPGARVHAVELDEPAYRYAVRNLAGTGTDVRNADIADAFTDLDGRVDVVVANPPYIPLTAWESVDPEARDHDPALALWSGDDGLDAIRVVQRAARRLLAAGGLVGCEHADVQGESVPAVFTAAGSWQEVRDHVDLAGRSRFTTARRI